jgi:hypothetical protein
MHQLVPFFKLFLGAKNDFFSSTFCRDHYALCFLLLLHKLILLYFEMSLHKTRKIPEKMDKNRCPKMRSTKHFWENSTRARCFAELFRRQCRDTIYALVTFKNKNGQKSSSNKMHDWVPKCAEFGVLMCPKWANVFSRKRFCRFGHIRAWCLFLSWLAGWGSDVIAKSNVKIKN